jgi:GntR family negative regulator for fad regulon and positive regulator of fabA
MTTWLQPPKTTDLVENRLITAFLDGTFPIDSTLPAERELAVKLGVTRPTLRETLQRLARDGWIEIRHGKATRVRNYWEEGNLAVLAAVAQAPEFMPPDFVPNLLMVRRLLAPTYTRMAFEKSPELVRELVSGFAALPEEPEAYASADFQLHHTLTIASGNPVFTLIFNGFSGSYETLAVRYFSLPETRTRSSEFYNALLNAQSPADAAAIMERVMDESITFWEQIAGGLR